MPIEGLLEERKEIKRRPVQSRDLESMSQGLKVLAEIMRDLDSLEVTNLDEVTVHISNVMRRVMKDLRSMISGIKIPGSFEVSNFPDPPSEHKITGLDGIRDQITQLISMFAQFELAPNITVEAPKIPEIKVPEARVKVEIPKIRVPEPRVEVNPVVDVDLSDLLKALKPLTLLSRQATKPIAVRMTDGRNFIKQLRRLEKGVVQAFAAGGMTSDEYMSAERKLLQNLYKRATATNTKATMGVASATVLANNSERISAIIVNDSDTAVYIACASTAVLNEGIRLNAYGGSVTFQNYTGIITGISSAGAKNVTVYEV